MLFWENDGDGSETVLGNVPLHGRACVRIVDVYKCVLIDIIAYRYHQELF